MGSETSLIRAGASVEQIARTSRRGWTILALMMLIAGTNHFNRISMPIAYDHRIKEQYGLEPTSIGWVYSAFLITYTLCMIPGGSAIDRFGAKAALTAVGLGSALFVVLTGATGFVLNDPRTLFLSLLVVRGLMGMISAPIHPACARLVGTWIPANGRSRANGLVNGAALVGIAATPPIFGALIGSLGWPAAFVVAGLFTLSVTLVWIALAAEEPRAVDAVASAHDAELHPKRADTPIGWSTLLRDRSLVLLTISYGTVGYFQYLFFYWMNYYFQKILALPDQTSRFYAAIPPLAMAVGMPLGGWISDRLELTWGARWGRRAMPMAGMGAGALFLVLGATAREPVWIVTWFALALGAVGAAEGPFWSTAIALGGRRGGSSAALLNTGGNAGGILAPIVTPWVGLHYGWPWSVALGSVVCVVGLVLWLGIEPERKDSINRDM